MDGRGGRFAQLAVVAAAMAALVGCGQEAAAPAERRPHRENPRWVERFAEEVAEEARESAERSSRANWEGDAARPFDQPDDAAAWELYQRVQPGDELRIEWLEKARGETLELAAKARDVGDVASWSELGPGNIGGRTRALLVSRANPSVMFASGVAGGVWKTSNGGASWTTTFDLLENLAVCALAFPRQGTDSEDTTRIYAGTGEGFLNSQAMRGAGIFVSSDGGASWSRLPATDTVDFQFVNGIAASPNDAQTLYVATRTGVWRTQDAGASWSRRDAVATLPDRGFTDIHVRPDGASQATEVVLAATGIRGAASEILRSVDGGGTFSQVFTTTNAGRIDLAIAPSNPDFMYALTSDRAGGDRVLDVFRSTDGGTTWSSRLTLDPPTAYSASSVKWLLLTNPIGANMAACFGGVSFTSSQGWYDNIIAVAPHDPNVVFAGGIDIFRSDDGGRSWGIVGYWWTDGLPGYVHADHHNVVFHPGWNGTTNQTLWSANDGGVHVTTNALAAVASGPNQGICHDAPDVPTAVTWTSLNNGYAVTQFYHGLPYPAPDGRYFGGTQDNGSLRGTDAAGPNAWVSINGGDGGYVAYHPTNPQVLFTANTRRTIQRALDGNSASPTFLRADGGITEPQGNFAFIAAYRMDPNNPEILWIGGRAPWRSSDAVSAPIVNSGGTDIANVTWTQAGTQRIGDQPTAWAIDPNNSNKVYYGSGIGNIFRTAAALTATSTTVWTPQTSGLPNVTGAQGLISWIEVDASDATGNTIYATQSRYGLGKVFRSSDGGATWSNVTANLPDMPVHCIAVQPGAPSVLWIGTELGPWRSTDGGTSWLPAGGGQFPLTRVESMTFQNPTTLYAFTHGRGVYRGVVVGAGVGDWRRRE